MGILQLSFLANMAVVIIQSCCYTFFCLFLDTYLISKQDDIDQQGHAQLEIVKLKVVPGQVGGPASGVGRYLGNIRVIPSHALDFRLLRHGARSGATPSGGHTGPLHTRAVIREGEAGRLEVALRVRVRAFHLFRSHAHSTTVLRVMG